MAAAGLISWPNAVSFLRLPLAAAFWVFTAPAARVAILLAAAATDWLDGWLARRLGGSVAGGEIIDPIFDKLFILTVVAALLVELRITPAELALTVVRDVLVLAGAAVVLLSGRRMRLQARMSGKIVTTLQGLVLLAAIVWQAAVLPLAITTAVTGIAAGIDYGRAARRSLHPAKRQP
jgi:phosphatidylglycerophosphate synthase